ncbi:MAG TPA: hypothetical protein VI461_05715 [Chitinophagaceae bacterium]|nr:hypothetical protein [Chitinophagaceae bacterium]
MPKKERQVKVSFTYDRLWEQKLTQVYHLLIPANQPAVFTEPDSDELIEQTSGYENSSDLYESIIRSAEGK